MSATSRLKLSVLTEQLERASRLVPTLSSGEALGRAIDRGLVFLETIGEPADAQREIVARRASFDLLRHRALVLAERNRELESAVAELATESRQLHDCLWELHERASRLKEELGQLKTFKTRPEPAPMIGSGGPGKVRRSTAEGILDGLKRLEVEVELPSDILARAEAVARRTRVLAPDWEGEPLEAILAYGLAARELDLPDLPGEDATGDSLIRPQATEALRYRIFELSEANRILEIRETAFRIDNRGMALRLDQLRAEVAGLEENAAARRVRREQIVPNRSLLRRLFGRKSPPAC